MNEQFTIADILLVEDHPGDQLLIQRALADCRIANRLHIVEDGVDALKFLRRQAPFENAVTPHLILLDLNLPRLDGHEVLREIKGDEQLAWIPVIVMTSSQSDRDVLGSYLLHANSFITKPPDLRGFREALEQISNYWFVIVKIPEATP